MGQTSHHPSDLQGETSKVTGEHSKQQGCGVEVFYPIPEVLFNQFLDQTPKLVVLPRAC